MARCRNLENLYNHAMTGDAADYWGNFHTRVRPKLSWLESNAIVEEVNRRVTGDANLNPYQWFMQTSTSSYSRALIVGCGAGELERDLLSMGLFKNALGIDISPKSIQKAIDGAKHAKMNELEFRVFDLDKDDYLSLGKFDLIIVNMVAHHVSNLDEFYKNINLMLNSEKSRVILNEYIGPNRFQHSKKVQSIINELLETFDDTLKPNHLIDGKELRLKYEITPLSHFEKHDPSEAVRSCEIMEYTSKYLNIISRCDYGGAINHMLLTGIIQNFEDQYPDGQILRLLMRFEEILERHQIIDSDFSFVVASRKIQPFFSRFFR